MRGSASRSSDAPASRRRPAAAAAAAYLLLALAAAWPLSTKLTSALPGEASGDTGVYIWNLWVFGHEWLAHGSSPLWTSHVLYPAPRVDLALHNYTIFQNLVGLTFAPLLGTVGAFNLTWILMQALSGVAVFLLARRVTADDLIAWLAGAVFACSPTIIARSTAHQSLVAAAPLAFFLLFVLRAADRRSHLDAALAGACAAWAAVCDAYYGIYCVPLLATVLVARAVTWERRAARPPRSRLAALVTALMVIPAGVIVLVLISGGGSVSLLGLSIRARTLYTPVLALTVLAVFRALLAAGRRGRWRVEGWPDARSFAQMAVGALTCAVLLAPLLYAAWSRVNAGGTLSAPVLWRSSPPGVDLLAFLIPNPNHPLAPRTFREFLTTRPDFFPENVASIPIVALVVIVLAAWRHGLPKVWLWIAVVFGSLAAGPFLHVAGVNTYVPGPWAVLRYVPILGAARTPTRFAIPMLIAVALLFAWSLQKLAVKRRALLLVAAALAFELLPVPRLVASAHVPSVYATIKADEADVSVLEIPFGVWDGTSQTGFANTATQYYQTFHEKRLVGGYLSRVPRGHLHRLLEFPTLRLFAELSGGAPAAANLREAAREDAPYFLDQARIGYVVIDTRLASADLRAAAIDLLALRFVTREGAIELYLPARHREE